MVDVDEADVAVLNQNLTKSKELFASISRSLRTISDKSSTASTKIKPILKDVNQLTRSRDQIDNDLSILSDVLNYAAQTAKLEGVLSNSIEVIGVKRYIDTLAQSKLLLKEMKLKIKRFRGILMNFETLIDKLDLNLENYFQRILNPPKVEDICVVFSYFYQQSTFEQDTINKLYIRSRSTNLVQLVKPLEQATKPVKRNSRIPYEKGTNGINRYNNELIKLIKQEIALAAEINQNIAIDHHKIVSSIVARVLNDSYTSVVDTLNEFVSSHGVLDNDILLLEVIENLDHFSKFMVASNLSPATMDRFNDAYGRLTQSTRNIFGELMKWVDARVTSVEKYNDKTIAEITVEIILRVRRVLEYPLSLLSLIQGVNLGSWLTGLKFVLVYTSVVSNNGAIDDSPETLLSSYFSDIIDCVMINIEIGLRSDDSKKSTQGYLLIKNLVLIETIINRSHQLFDTLSTIGMDRLARLKNRFLKLFLDDWNYASYIIIRDMTNITTTNAIAHGAMLPRSSSLGLSSKEKEQVKELFRKFNESFEEALQNYEKFNISDPNLRNYLSNEIKKLTVNAYFKLYEKYGTSDFTKNRSKYIKWDKHQFEQVLNERL